LLLERKADPDLRDNVWNTSPLSLAASFDAPDAVKVLLAARSKGADQLLISAAAQGQADLVKSVLEHTKPAPELLSTALVLTRDKAVKEALTKAGGKPFPAASDEEKKLWKTLAGQYENPNGARLAVMERDGVLLAGGGRVGASVLRPVEKFTFRVVGDDKTRLVFETNGGKVTRVTAAGVAYEPVRPDDPVKPVKPAAFKDEPGVVREPKNWPSFRGEGATGVADGQHPPAVWDVEKQDSGVWKTKILGLGHACPVVWGNRVFVATAVSSDPKSELRPGLYGSLTMAKDRTKHTWKVYCLDRDSGKILWEKTAHEGVPKVKRHIKATHANSTPACDGKRLVVSFGSEGLYCFDLDGNQRWKADLGVLDGTAFNDPEIQWEHGSSPILYRDLVIVQCDRSADSYIAAYHADTGKQVWKTPRDEITSWGTPTVVETKGGAEIVCNGTTAARGYDPLTGKELWRLGRNSQITVPTPFAGDGMVFIASGYSPIQPIYAVFPGGRGDLTLKEGVESSDQIAWSKTRGGPYMPTPIYYRGHLYVCSNSGQVTCYEGRTGKQVYKEKLGGSAGYTASPVAADGKLYFTGEDGKVYVVEAGPAYKLLAINELKDVTLATPAISNGRIFFRTKEYLIGVGRRG
jgi:outer membrane protein assembly factor BamB